MYDDPRVQPPVCDRQPSQFGLRDWFSGDKLALIRLMWSWWQRWSDADKLPLDKPGLQARLEVALAILTEVSSRTGTEFDDRVLAWLSDPETQEFLVDLISFLRGRVSAASNVEVQSREDFSASHTAQVHILVQGDLRAASSAGPGSVFHATAVPVWLIPVLVQIVSAVVKYLRERSAGGSLATASTSPVTTRYTI